MKTSFQAQEVRRTGLIRVLESDEAANQTHAGDMTEADIRRLYETDNDRRALSMQMDRQDELSRICMGGGCE